MVDSNPKQSCRLCLQATDNPVNIQTKSEDSSIASILAEHYWFQRNDDLTEWLCQTCWLQTKTFHDFYLKVERFHKRSVDTGSGGLHETVIVESKDTAVDSVLDVIKCGEPDQTFQTTDSQNDDSESQTEEVSGKTSNKKPKIDDDTDQSVKEELKARIREFFTMECVICSDVQFETFFEVYKHYRTVHKAKDIRYLSDLAAHISEENTQLNELFTMKCEICNEVLFGNVLEVEVHYRKFHQKEGFLICCSKKIWRPDAILEHVQQHVNTDDFSCNDCGKHFVTKSAFKIDFMPLDSIALKCSSCSSSFVRELLKDHANSRTDEKFACNKCDKSFRSLTLLRNHIRRHKHSLDNKCLICFMKFKSKDSLNNHIDTQHLATVPPPKLQCPHCDALLKHEASLKIHLNLVHMEGESHAVQCRICKKSLKNKLVLLRHNRRVHGHKRHQCVTCDKTFKSAKILTEHTATHTGEYLYDCPYCGKKFKQSSGMYRHRKKVHLAELTRDSTQRI